MSAPDHDHDHAGPAPGGPEHPDDMGCLRALEMFYAYLDGQLDPSESAADFEAHLAHCRSCFSRAELEGRITERLRAAASQQASEALRRRMRILFENL